MNNYRAESEQVVEELLKVLKENKQKERANKIYETVVYIDILEKKLDYMVDEMQKLQKQLDLMQETQQNTTIKRLSSYAKKTSNHIKDNCKSMKEQLLEVKQSILQKASDIVVDVNIRGQIAINKVDEILNIRDKLAGIRENVRECKTKVNQMITRIELFGIGMREASHRLQEAFKDLQGKERTTQTADNNKISKTELVKKPFAICERLLSDMENRLDVMIDKVENRRLDVNTLDVEYIDVSEETLKELDDRSDISYTKDNEMHEKSR